MVLIRLTSCDGLVLAKQDKGTELAMEAIEVNGVFGGILRPFKLN